MLPILDVPGRSRRGLTRREWLRVGGLGVLGLSLPRLLATEEARQSKVKSCVLFLLHGGPSQLDTWDMKPLAPDEVRSEFKSIATTVPGMQISEHQPRLARLADRFSIVRSMTHTSVFHNTATYYVMTGQPPPRDVLAFTPSENDFPHLGAQLAYKYSAGERVPTAVSLPDSVGDGPYTTPGQNGGFLGARYAPFGIMGNPDDEKFSVDGLGAGEETKGARVTDRQALLKNMGEHLGRLSEDRKVQHFDAYQQRAFDMLTSNAARRAFDLGRESVRVRERYGRNKYAQALLLARRLVEAGVRLVTVYWGGHVNNPLPHWDTHADNNRRLKDELLPPFDMCFSAFLEDLHARGLLESTIVVCMGEFGRTPRLGQFTGNGVSANGRDHWAQCYSLLVAGGSAPGGRIIGKSDKFAAYPAEDPHTPQDLAATILQTLGVNPAEEVKDGFDRMVPLSTGRYKEALFGK